MLNSSTACLSKCFTACGGAYKYNVLLCANKAKQNELHAEAEATWATKEQPHPPNSHTPTGWAVWAH
eukprot:13907648-Alexandrium_andersonii.AAC.1